MPSGTIATLPATRPNSSLGSVTEYDSGSWSNYNGVIGRPRSRAPFLMSRCVYLVLAVFFFAAFLVAAFLAGVFLAGTFLGAAVFFGFFPAEVFPRAARVFAASASFNSESNSAGVMGRADLRRRSMS